MPDRKSITWDKPKQQQLIMGVRVLKMLHFSIRNPTAQSAEYKKSIFGHSYPADTYCKDDMTLSLFLQELKSLSSKAIKDD